MEPSFMNAGAPGLLDVLFDPEAMAVWEQVRCSRRALALNDVAHRCSMSAPRARTMLDRLQAVGLVEMTPAGRGRPIRWRSARDRLIVTFDLADTALVAELARRGATFQRELFDAAVERHGAPNADPLRAWRFQAAGNVRLLPDDLRELSRRIEAVTEFIGLLTERGRSESGDLPMFANHAILVRIEPLEGPVLPQPDIDFVAQSVADRKFAARAVPARHVLTARERSVADALVGGLTRTQVASALGISVNTVGTLSLRIYRKLGVRTRLELAHAMQALGRPSADGEASVPSDSAD
jgi:DNA-binding CsgD family transcriptional regulator